ncbi:MAG: inositol monophosphatase family protein [Acidimicrobiia bacterium]
MHPDLPVALEAAREGAAVVREGFSGAAEVHMKGEVNPVTAIDTDAEDSVRAVLGRERPADQVLGEEEGGTGWDEGRVWIVDPLDGTVNFVHHMPHVAVSVALWEDGAPLVGVVIDVMHEEEFAAVAGLGSLLNGQPVRVSGQDDLGEALVVTGFPYDRRRRADDYATVVGAVLARVQGLRRLGSAALDFAWVACGRFDAYWEYGLAPWDAAAGVLLVEEAGGQVGTVTGARFDLDSPTVVASNGLVHDALAGVVHASLPADLR